MFHVTLLVTSVFLRIVTVMFVNNFYGFAAFMRNQMTWGGAGAESFLEVDVNLNLTLEVCLILIKYIKFTYNVRSIFVSLSWDRRVVILYVMMIEFVFKDHEGMNCIT